MEAIASKDSSPSSGRAYPQQFSPSNFSATPVAKRLAKLQFCGVRCSNQRFALLAWQLEIKIEEVPVQILETRNPTVTVLRRVAKNL